MLKKENITKKLKMVVDPELGVDIVELGLIYDINITGGKKAVIKMTFTTPACPMITTILEDIKKRLEELGEDKDITVEVVFEPPWTPEKMSEKAKILLGY
ncbi:MAG: metal-sulfur cluster assembly factor [Candidatus Micrarchaeota archaeon]